METAGRLYNTLTNLAIAPLTQQTFSVRYCEDLGWGVWYKYEEDGKISVCKELILGLL